MAGPSLGHGGPEMSAKSLLKAVDARAETLRDRATRRNGKPGETRRRKATGLPGRTSSRPPGYRIGGNSRAQAVARDVDRARSLVGRLAGDVPGRSCRRGP